MLLVAQRQWQRDGQDFAMTDMTPTFRQGLERLGLAQDHFDKEPAQ
jgi:anti-anti-sigma regulatory factor